MSKSLARVLYRPQQCERIASQSSSSQKQQRCAYSAFIALTHNDHPIHRQHRISTACLHSQRHQHLRPFSSSSKWQASVMGKSIKPMGRKQRAPSMAVQMAQQQAKALREGSLPDDIGLLPDTFIMPRGANRPNWVSDFKGRMLMERRRLLTRIQEAASAFLYRFWMVRPTPRLHLRRIAPLAARMHRDMYTSFATGNLAPVENHICPGLLSSLRGRIAQREPNQSLKWTLHRYISKPRLVSYKAALIPAPRNADGDVGQSGFIQAIVRIHSVQSLKRVKKVHQKAFVGSGWVTNEIEVDVYGKEILGKKQVDGVPEDAKETVEYVVVQKPLRRSKEGEWMVWGNAEEMTLERLQRERKAKQESRLAGKAVA